MEYIYTNHSTEIFEGFYESHLFNADTELNISEGLESPHEIKDFKGFCREVAEKSVSLLEPYESDNSPITNFSLYSIVSPKYYNYGTDRIQIKMDLDLVKLKFYCLKLNDKKFDEYLKENFTSRSGFISFVPNSLESFKSKLDSGSESDQTILTDTMIEFYLLSETDLDSYHQELYEFAWDKAYEYAEEVGSPSLVWIHLTNKIIYDNIVL